jgi:hypothetical protein
LLSKKSVEAAAANLPPVNDAKNSLLDASQNPA